MEDNPLVTFEDIEVTREVQNALKNLGEPYHSIIHLYYFKNLKVKEISKVSDVPEGTIKSLLHRGRNIIKQGLIKKGFIEYYQDEEVKSGE